MQRECGQEACRELSEEEAIEEVAACACHLFTTVSAQQARALASVVLRDLRARGISLMWRPTN